MKLTIRERLVLLQALPASADIASLRIMRKLRESLSFSEMEQTRFQLRHELEGDSYTYRWADEFEGAEVEIDIGEKATDIVVQALRDLNRQKKLTENHLTLWEKFIGE